MKKLLLLLLRGYKFWLSPLLPSSCRYWPTCSEYARQAVELHGSRRGVWLAVRRILRCHPWGGSGLDPVPPVRIKDQRRQAALAPVCCTSCEGAHHRLNLH